MLCWPCAVRRLSNTWVEGAHLTSAWVHFVRGLSGQILLSAKLQSYSHSQLTKFVTMP